MNRGAKRGGRGRRGGRDKQANKTTDRRQKFHDDEENPEDDMHKLSLKGYLIYSLYSCKC